MLSNLKRAWIDCGIGFSFARARMCFHRLMEVSSPSREYSLLEMSRSRYDFDMALKAIFSPQCKESDKQYYDEYTARQVVFYITRIGEQVLKGQGRNLGYVAFLMSLTSAAELTKSSGLTETNRVVLMTLSHLLPICSHPLNNKGIERGGGSFPPYISCFYGAWEQANKAWERENIDPDIKRQMQDALREGVALIDESFGWPDKDAKSAVINLFLK